jgi:hypothetical protein
MLTCSVPAREQSGFSLWSEARVPINQNLNPKSETLKPKPKTRNRNSKPQTPDPESNAKRHWTRRGAEAQGQNTGGQYLIPALLKDEVRVDSLT